VRNRRSILFLLMAIALLGVAHLAVRSSDVRRRPQRRLSLVELPDAVDWLKLKRPGRAAVVLRRDDESGWRIAEPFAGRADGPAVARLVDVLTQSPIMDVVTDGDLVRLGRTRSDFSLSDPAVSVTIGSAQGSEVVAFGLPTPSADGVYASVEGVDAVFVVPLDVLSAVDRPTEEFRSRSVFSADPASVSAFALRQGTGTNLSFARERDGWTVDGERASKSRVEGFLAEILSAEAIGFVWPVGASNEAERVSASFLAGYGLEPENAVTVTFKGVDGADRQLSLGSAADPGLVYASVQNGSAVVTVKDALKTAALQKKSAFADARVFPVEESSVACIRLVDGEVSYVLARTGDGPWRLEAPVAAPAEQEVVRRVLSRLLVLSASASDGSGGFSVSLAPDAAPVSVPRELVLANDRLDDLRSVEVVRFDQKEVKRLVRTPGGKGATPVSVVRAREDAAWVVESSEDLLSVRADALEKVFETLNPLAAVRVERLKVSAADLDGYGLGTPCLTLAVDLDRENAVRRNVLIGEKTEGGRFATVGSADAVFVISEEAVERLSAELVGK